MQTPNRLSNRYQVLGVLGDGGFGKTFLVEDIQMPSNRKCVLKQLKPVNDNPQIHQMVKDRFQREAAILEKLGDNHEQIPRLYAYFSEGDQFYLVEEWIEGDTLLQKVQKEGRQSEATVQDILTRLLPAIAYIHQQGIVHRDIKPDNIVLRHPDSKPVLIDFGAVKETMSTIVNSQGNSSHSIVVGTPGYMPSEQLAGRPIYASDLYSLGMTAIYLLTAKAPQELPTDPMTGEVLWRDHAPGISNEFFAFLNRAIHMQPQARYATAPEMLIALNQLSMVTKPPTPAMPPQGIPTEVSLPPSTNHSTLNTVVTAPSNPSIPPTPSTQAMPAAHVNPSGPVIAPNNDWKKAVITGGIIGACILGGALVLRSQGLLNSNSQVAQQSPSPSIAPSQSPSASPSSSASASPEKPVENNTQPAEPPQKQQEPSQPPPPNNSANTNATIVGQPGSKNMRSGPGTNYGVAQTVNTGDRVEIVDSSKDSGGYTWYKIYAPSSGASGWVAAQLVQSDNQPEPQKPTQPEKPSQPPSSSNTNATLTGAAGSKNIRSGPGTSYGVRHIAYPGDRVRILESAQDSGGYTWYKVYFPNSGADGWIAAQLVKVD